jgi:pimeloyl-ACP methyl ester carboxylesterase
LFTAVQDNVFRLLAALTLASTLAVPREDDRGRPVVLLVHGRGMLTRDTAETRKMWLDALTSGGKKATALPLLNERDVRVVWYADVLDPRSSAGCDYAANDPRARRSASIDPDLKSLVSTVGSLFDMITSLVADTENVSHLRALSADASFLGDSRKRCASEQRLAEAIDGARREGRPVILVAHSLGSLVAYDYLSSRSDTGLVQRFITVGAMVGANELRQLLIGGDASDTLARPAGVKSWINIRHDNDLFATSISTGRNVIATPPSDEPDPHELVGYLRGPVTATEILGSWCAAFGSKAPAGCASMRLPPS